MLGRRSPAMGVLPLASILMCCLLHVAAAIQFDIAQNAEECFFDDLHHGTRVSVAYAVVTGSQRVIDIEIKDPNGVAIYADKASGEGRYTFPARSDGKYSYCFSNRMGHTGPKAVQVSFNNGEELPEIEELIKKHNVDRVTRYLQQLSHLTREMKFQQSSYLHVSERRRSMLASTNKRVSFWSIVEIMSVVGVSALQILFLKRMFSRQGTKGRMV